MKHLIILLLLTSVAFPKIYIESNYPLRNNNFSSLQEGELSLLLWVLQRLKDVRDIKVSTVGDDTVVYVERYPILREVEIKGNWFASDEELKSLILIREGEPLVDFDVERAKETLRTFYHRKGFLDADAEIELKVDREGYASIKVLVREGDLYFTKDAVFMGGISFPKEKLLRKSGLRLGDVFSEEEARKATFKLYEFYRKEGFLESSLYFEGVRKEKLNSPFLRVLFPGSERGSFKDTLFSLFRGLSNFASHPVAVLKAIFGKGSGAVPVYSVNEGRRYNIEFRGNRSFDRYVLMSLVDLDTPGVDVFFLEKTRNAIEEFYQRKGFFDVDVEYSYVEGTVEFLIKEGVRYKLKVLGFKGVELPQYYDKDLIEDRLEEFLKDVRRSGFLSAQLRLEEDVDRKEKIVYLMVLYKPGKKVWLKDVKFLGKDRHLRKIFSRYRSLLPAVLDEKMLDNLHKDIRNYLLSRGYLDGDFSLRVEVEEDEDNLYLSYLYTVQKGERYRYGKLLIYGNEKTHPREIYYTVIKERFFSSQAEEESLWNLIQSENFTGVRMENFIDKEAKRVHRLVEVREDKRGVLELGVGYNTEEKLKLEGNLKLKNLFGVGLILRLGASKSQKYETYEVGLSDKFFFSRKYFGDTALFRRLEFHNSFDLESEGYSLSLGYRPSRWFSVSPFFSSTDNRVVGFGSGEFYIRKLGVFLIYERRDDPINPKNIDHASLKVSKAEGDRDYYKVELNTFLLREVLRNLSVNGRFYSGWVGDSAPIFDRFFLGGLKDMRGYDFEGIGYPLGGKTALFGRLETLFMVKEPLWVGVYGDAGGVGNRFSDSLKGLKYDVGVAVGIDTPAGFLRFDVAKPLSKVPEPLSKVKFYLSIGFLY